MNDDVTDTLLRIPVFEGRVAGDFRFDRLGGLTNRNFRVVVDNESYMLRLAGDGTGDFIDRKAEEICARITAEAGINAEVLYFDASDGVQLTRFIEGAATMTIQSFRNMDAIARTGRVLRKVHDCDERFSTEFNAFSMMDDYFEILRGKNAWIPDGFEKTHAETEIIRAALAKDPAPLVPCHCDPLCENFLDTGERVYVIDWEYAGNNDAMWDLGDLSVEARLGPEQDAALLHAYFDGPPPPGKFARMVMYKALSDLFWTLWAAIQVANESPIDDFRVYGQGRYESAMKLMATDGFKAELAVLAG